jgi:glycosyltransferase involved in cell wall biosynthesis
MQVSQFSKGCAELDTASAGRRLLLFAYYFPPLNESGAQRPFRFVRYLERQGYRTQVITYSAQGGGAPWPDAVEAQSDPHAGYSTKIGNWISRAVQRILPYNDQLPWITPALAEARRLVPAIRPAAILSTSPPVVCHLAALASKRRYGIPWIADFRDPIYGNPHRSRRITRPYEAAVEGAILRNADAVIANTDTAAESLRRRYPQYGHKVHLIWNGYDPEQPLAARAIAARKHKVVLHAGSLYGGRHPGDLLESLARLIQRGRLNPATVRIRLIGWMDLSQPWATAPASEALREKGCLEFVNEVLPQEEAIRQMTVADYLLLLDGNESDEAVQVPAKLFQYIRIGRPVLAFTTKNSPSERILSQSGVRYVSVNRGMRVEEVDERVAGFFDLPSEACMPSAWFEQEFNAEEQAKTLASILQAVGA